MVQLTTQIQILIILFSLAFGVPIVRYLYRHLKVLVDKYVVHGVSRVNAYFKNTMDGKSRATQKKKKKKPTAASKVAPSPERKQGP